MRRNDFFDIEEQIRRAVDSASDYINYDRIKDTINYEAENILDEVKRQLRRGSDFIQRATEDVEVEKTKSKYNPQKIVRSNYITQKPKGRIKGVLYSIIGTTMSIFWGFILLISVILGINAFNGRHVDFKASTILFTIFTCIGIYLLLRGKSIRSRINRFRRYASIVERTNYCTLDALANSVRKDYKFVIKDLEKMIDLEMFKEAYIDEEHKNFILSTDVYEAYLYAEKSYKENKQKQEEESRKASENAEVYEIINLGKRYISDIRSANDSIPGIVISKKLDELEKVVTAIFNNIEKNTSMIPDVKKFINHYLPMTLKLVNTYKELDNQTIEGENIRKAKNEIEKSLDLINTAFEKLLDDLFKDVTMDVSSDISVLKTLFTQEGLTENEFNKGEHK